MDFTNKIAVITGSGRGIGREIALRLARGGADIVVNFFRNRAPAEIRKLGRRAVIVKSNVGAPDGMDKLIDQAGKAFGGLDILICNAASGYNRLVMEQKIIFLCTPAAEMIRGQTIVVDGGYTLLV